MKVWEIVITIISAVASSSALTAIINAVNERKREKRQKDTGTSAGVRILLYDRIKLLGKSYIERGYITPEELKDLIEMHKVYHDALNGNGFLDTIMDQVRSLPIK